MLLIIKIIFMNCKILKLSPKIKIISTIQQFIRLLEFLKTTEFYNLIFFYFLHTAI